MKNLPLIVALIGSMTASAQLVVKKLDGTPIVSGDVFVFHQLEEPDNYLGFKVYNTYASQSMKVKARVVSMSNATGSDLQLCLGDICLSTITAGNSYPSSPVTIPAGGQNSDFDHILNYYGGTNPALPVEYVIRISELDNNLNEIGTPVQFTYRYTSLLATENFAATADQVQLKSSVVSNALEVKAFKNTQMEVFDVNGKSLRREQLTSGEHTVDVSDLASGLYILSFSSDDQQKSTAKFIKK